MAQTVVSPRPPRVRADPWGPCTLPASLLGPNAHSRPLAMVLPPATTPWPPSTSLVPSGVTPWRPQTISHHWGPSAQRPELHWLFMPPPLPLIWEQLQTLAVSWSLGHPAQARPRVGSRCLGQEVRVWRILLFRSWEASRQKWAVLLDSGRDGVRTEGRWAARGGGMRGALGRGERAGRHADSAG